MPHSFPKGEIPAEIKWGRPPGLRGTPSSRSFCGCGCLGARRGRPGGWPRTWASAPLFAQMSESGKTMWHWAFSLQAGFSRLSSRSAEILGLGSMMPDGDEAEESRAQARGPLWGRLKPAPPCQPAACHEWPMPAAMSKASGPSATTSSRKPTRKRPNSVLLLPFASFGSAGSRMTNARLTTLATTPPCG